MLLDEEAASICGETAVELHAVVVADSFSIEQEGDMYTKERERIIECWTCVSQLQVRNTYRFARHQ